MVSTAPRLDLWLVSSMGMTRPAARALIEGGLVRVNGRPGRPGQRVREADVVRVADPPPSPAEGSATEGPPVSLDIVYEDDWLAVVDKPAGLVVHPAPGHPTGTLADGLRQRGATWSLIGGPERAGIVHRLDRETSGLLVVARTEAAHRSLAAQLRDRTLGRTYWALVHGGLREATGTIDAPIGRDQRNRLRMAVVDGGRPAVTDFAVRERCPAATLLEVELRTGRTHQIRVHLAHIGRPLVGDPVYGRRGDPAGRLALHACRLRLRHPADGAARTFESALPAELGALLERARAGRA